MKEARRAIRSMFIRETLEGLVKISLWPFIGVFYLVGLKRLADWILE